MTNKRPKLGDKAGAPPGTLLYIGDEELEKVRLSVFSFDHEKYHEHEVQVFDKLGDYILPDHVNWVNLDGVHHPEVVQGICERFGIHPLVQEDIVNTEQRPKMENYQDYLYFVIKMIDVNEEGEMDAEQVSIILGKNFILSFQEEPGDIFEPIRQRVRSLENRLIKMGPEYVAYRLMDSIVDHYFLILERIGERIDELEEKLIEDADKDTLTQVYELKRDLIFLRKSSWPMREIASELQRLESPLIAQDLHIFLRDFYDHIIRVIETIETYRDTTSSMVDLYMSSVSIKMNEVMKVLTVISTIFIPLTFITGFYGMNIDNMPEVHSKWAYPAIIGVMVIIVILQLIWFKRKKWL